MKREETILARYVELSRAVTEEEKSGTVYTQQAAADRFWAFVERHLYSINIAEIRKVDADNEMELTAFT